MGSRRHHDLVPRRARVRVVLVDARPRRALPPAARHPPSERRRRRPASTSSCATGTCSSPGSAPLLSSWSPSRRSPALRRRIRYELWHLIHLWSYVGIGLVLPHELVSADFVRGLDHDVLVVPCTWCPWSWCWSSASPARSQLSARHRLRVAGARRRDARRGVAGRRRPRPRPAAGPLRPVPALALRRTADAPAAHPYSISRAPDAATLRVTIGGPGDGAAAGRSVAVGARVAVEGPYGALAPLRRRHPHLLLIAAGMGITPFRALLEDSPLRAGRGHPGPPGALGGGAALRRRARRPRRRSWRRGRRAPGAPRESWSFLPAVTGDLAPRPRTRRCCAWRPHLLDQRRLRVRPPAVDLGRAPGRPRGRRTTPRPAPRGVRLVIGAPAVRLWWGHHDAPRPPPSLPQRGPRPLGPADLLAAESARAPASPTASHSTQERS